MKIDLVYYTGGNVWYVPFKSINISGDTAQAYRSASISVSNTTDGRTRKVPFVVGEEVRVMADEAEFFRGIIFQSNIDDRGNQEITAHDYNVYLTKNSDSVNFKNMTASNILRKLCGKYEIEVGNIADTRHVIPRVVERGKSIYEIVKETFTETKRETGRIYKLTSTEGKLNLINVDDNQTSFTVENRRNILSASISESIEETRTRVKLTGGDEDNPVTVESSSPNAGRFGVMQHYEHKSDLKTADKLRPLANELLKQMEGIDQEIRVEALGDINVVSSSVVRVNESMTGLEGDFYVESDSHSFDPNGVHTMALTLKRKGGG